jgi:hypothetical protein
MGFAFQKQMVAIQSIQLNASLNLYPEHLVTSAARLGRRGQGGCGRTVAGL